MRRCTCTHAPEQHLPEIMSYPKGVRCDVEGCECKASREDMAHNHNLQVLHKAVKDCLTLSTSHGLLTSPDDLLRNIAEIARTALGRLIG